MTAIVTTAADRTAQVSNVGNTVLATEVSGTAAGWFADTFNKNSNVYDTAIDAAYNHARVGSSLTHHIVDGNHSIWGALKAAHGALPHDSLTDEVKGAAEHLLRDTASRSGINPFFSISPSTYRSLTGFLDRSLGIPPSWTADMLTFNAPELIGAGLAVIPLTLGWNRLGAERLAELSASLAIASVASANPVLAAVAVVAATRTLTKAKSEGFTPTLRGLAAGAALTGVAVATSALIPGPPLLGAVLGIGAGLAARHGYRKLFPASTPASPGR